MAIAPMNAPTVPTSTTRQLCKSNAPTNLAAAAATTPRKYRFAGTALDHISQHGQSAFVISAMYRTEGIIGLSIGIHGADLIAEAIHAPAPAVLFHIRRCFRPKARRFG